MSNYDGLGKIIQQLREEKGLSRQQVCLGICDESLLRKYENGQRQLNLFARIRLLERLGEGNMGFEFYVNGSEFKEWGIRQDIIRAYKTGDKEQLISNISSFELHHNSNDAFSTQFLLEFRALSMLQQEELSDEERNSCQVILKQAMEKTIIFENNKIKNFMLSPEEINLALEYYSCFEPAVAFSKVEALYHYVEDLYGSAETAAVILPKIVYRLNNLYHKSSQKMLDLHTIYQMIDKTIALLISTKRSQYLLELVDILSESEYEKKEYFADLKIFIIGIEKLADKSVVTLNDSYLFQTHKIIQLGSIISQRRMMYSMSAEELANGICDTKTLSRLENNKTDGQAEIVIALLNKLKIAGVIQKGNVLCDDLGLYRKECVFRDLVGTNITDFEVAESVLSEMKQKLDLNNIYNRQYILSREASVAYRRKILDADSYCKALMEALSLTLDLNVINSKKAFLSRAEIICCYNIAVLPINTEAYDRVLQYMLSLADNRNEIDDIKIYEMAVITCARYYLDRQKPEKAFFIYQELLNAELSQYRLYLLSFCILMMQYCMQLFGWLSANNERKNMFLDEDTEKVIDYIAENYSRFIT